MTFTLQGLDHIVLRTEDVPRMVAFYCEVLGCTLERSLEDLGLYQLRAGQSLIDLVDLAKPLGQKGGAGPGDDGRNLDHFCLRIEPFEPDALRRHLEARGIEASEIARRYGAEGFGPSLYLADPDGNTVELKGPPEA
jgi:catechol 2,3-dioxygenase-like lactoylglutathione lyase family enzyme